MNGPQHYAEAAKLAASAMDALKEASVHHDPSVTSDVVEYLAPYLKLAQVHATLAQAAATAATIPAMATSTGDNGELRRRWAKVISPEQRPGGAS